uniref:Uncharacterized protein n=1 Tax=Globisporangium ultimum (strain ATCC 200006 / CBS 805.95 / DAOM BR144) TaxID=431595 RepID=K3WJ58_GLOUD
MPIVFQVIFAFRSTVWMVCFAAYLHDLLTMNPRNVALTAAFSACFLISVRIGVVLDAIDARQQYELVTMNAHVLIVKDILVNTMTTMLTLAIRISYHKYTILKNANEGPLELPSSGTGTEFNYIIANFRRRLRCRSYQSRPRVHLRVL